MIGLNLNQGEEIDEQGKHPGVRKQEGSGKSR